MAKYDAQSETCFLAEMDDSYPTFEKVLDTLHKRNVRIHMFYYLIAAFQHIQEFYSNIKCFNTLQFKKKSCTPEKSITFL